MRPPQTHGDLFLSGDTNKAEMSSIAGQKLVIISASSLISPRIGHRPKTRGEKEKRGAEKINRPPTIPTN